jgi:hypothetical protein
MTFKITFLKEEGEAYELTILCLHVHLSVTLITFEPITTFL